MFFNEVLHVAVFKLLFKYVFEPFFLNNYLHCNKSPEKKTESFSGTYLTLVDGCVVSVERRLPLFVSVMPAAVFTSLQLLA